MSKWAHIICDDCWEARHKKVPFRAVDQKTWPCCFCGEPTQSGIFVREDPQTVKCKGSGDYHDED
jgi:hypothetical protein